MKLWGFRVAGALLVVNFTVNFTAGCSPTTYDESATTAAHTAPTTTLPISTDPAEVLPQMLDEVAHLAQRVIDRDGEGDAATRIEQMWAAIEPTVTIERPELVPDFDFVVRRCRAAADRNRPADADRALKNLESLVESYLDV